MPRFRQRFAIVLIRSSPIMAILGVIAAEVTDHHVLAQPLVLLAVVLAPALLPRKVLYPDADPPPSNPDGDDGGGRGPGPSPLVPVGPRGGIPLPDADQARVRVRDHSRPRLIPSRSRRAPTEPRRAPAKTLSA